MSETKGRGPALIKCVIWDIDNTLLDGTYLESGTRPPPPDPGLLAVARELDTRGILLALASRNPPEAADYAARVTGLPFAAVETGWGAKSEAVGRIIADLGIGADTVAFVDDELIERAEVAAALPDVLVLSPDEAAQAPAWPAFSPPVITAEGRRRGELYAQRRQRRDEARAYGGSRDDFLRYAGTRVQIGPAGAADVPRLHELSVRTSQFNSGGAPASAAELAARLAEPGTWVVVVRLSDRFGDDGIVGGAVAQRRPGAARTVPLLMMSCRALGRGVLEALLTWLTREAAADGAAELAIPCLVTERNVPLRLALVAAGFRAPSGPAAEGTPALFTRPLSGPLPELPDWAQTVAEPAIAQPAAGVLDELRALLAQVTGRAELAGLAPETPLFGDGVGLDSLTGTLLLTRIRDRFGVDVAAEDLNLDALATLGTLAAFVDGAARS